ncbi:phospholipase D family protein [Acinetobacter sp. ESL0695]|uniref:phospholipase D-like domain-containing protein n=1 Tax=Acinetobacter sp. ESL0695 TaxID=2983215 RepID=UPI0023F19664|nr:phospholipase D family protein [Acinetobacter sp. ESL0695]WEV49986.1 phospholipase D family protein [Acinetobacter sp. ESL0695]
MPKQREKYRIYLDAINTKAYGVLTLSFGILFGLHGCSTLPPLNAPKPTYSTDFDTSKTALSHLITPLKQQNQGLTGYHVLFDPLEAIAARLSLINKAQKTLDIQYYIWDNDKIGALALYDIIQAADRGVKVRLLIDDNNAKKMEGIFLALDQHVNIQVKLYNPYKYRNFRPLDMVLDLKRINRRMHIKSFIVDNQIALIGGRNMSNQYYFTSDNYQFSDIDILLVGQSVDQINHSFDDYWNDSYAYPIRQLVNPRQHLLRYDSLKKQLTEHYKRVSVQDYLNLANHSDAFDHWLYHDLRLDWVKADVVSDAPSKIHGTAKPNEFLQQQLSQYLKQPKKHLDIVSAYFVPEKKGTDFLNQLSNNGVQVRILTNSFKANDVWLVHAFYSKYREALLKNGVQLYEFLPTLSYKELKPYTKNLSREAKISLKSLSRSSLHAKMMAVDDQVFIGSFNLDPRSSQLNSEIGVLLNSPALADEIHQTLSENIDAYSYQLQLTPDNKITWTKKLSTGGTVTFDKEPKMTWWQHNGLQLISWLPLEGMM